MLWGVTSVDGFRGRGMTLCSQILGRSTSTRSMALDCVVEGPHEPFVAHPGRFICISRNVWRWSRSSTMAFVAVKAYDTSWAARFAHRFVADDGLLRLIAELHARRRHG